MKIKANLEQLDLLMPYFSDDKIYILQGDLASGKTTLVKKIAEFYLKSKANSPTFSVLNTYTDGKNFIYHYDIYQKGTKALLANGLYENLFLDGKHFVEWGDDAFVSLCAQFGLDYQIIKINSDEKGRLYEFC